MKAATYTFRKTRQQLLISIHAAREGGDLLDAYLTYECGISIHAAREGGDDKTPAASAKAPISIHAAREGGDCSYL